MTEGDSHREVTLRGEATQCLQRVASGDGSARDQLFELVYSELRDQASSYLSRENAGHTLQSTALVHEAWLKLIGEERSQVKNRGHFLALAAQAMRRIVIDHARTKRRQKRGGAWKRVDLDDAVLGPGEQEGEAGFDDLLAVDQALEKLREKSPRMARIVELRFFGGLAREEVAEALGLSRSTVIREWRAARALMSRLLEAGEANS